ncbi:hypothetical protein [Photobacterium phosphoreum]|uniref:hypothetical protein n=1 Tax=Photobacterium phosphoreum TaxID=659 RepID=UPI00242F6A39|nr:hypothetical protein [Photobacterium phosphoreum]
MNRLVTVGILGTSLVYNCFAYANVEVKTAHELAIFRLGYIHSITPFDLKKPTNELQTIANMYALTYAIQALPDEIEQKYYALPSITQKNIAFEYCKAYSIPKNTKIEATSILNDILSIY